MDKLDINAGTTGARERLSQDMRMLVRDAEDLLHAAQKQGGEGVAAMRERLEASIRQAKSQIWDGELMLLERARHTAKQTNEYVHGHPWLAVGAAAGAGLLLGAVLLRR